jgi:hypothetical protein
LKIVEKQKLSAYRQTIGLRCSILWRRFSFESSEGQRTMSSACETRYGKWCERGDDWLRLLSLAQSVIISMKNGVNNASSFNSVLFQHGLLTKAVDTSRVLSRVKSLMFLSRKHARRQRRLPSADSRSEIVLFRLGRNI